MRDVTVVVSIDTEEDNWHRTRTGVTVENIAELRTLATCFERLGIRPTYFTSYQVAIDPRAAETLREVSAAGRAEIGAHFHPWDTPPLDEAFVPRNSMLKNLPAAPQRAQLGRVNMAVEEAFVSVGRGVLVAGYRLGRDKVG